MRLLHPIYVCGLLASSLIAGQEQPSTDWHSHDLSFRVLNIASAGHLLWVCGTDESIAVSSDNGVHWQVRHQTMDGGLLLNIDFADAKFGYAAGTGGLILTTVDGGETWLPHAAINETILQVSFADLQHGIIRTPASLLFTVDGGLHWSTVSAGQNSEDIKQFPYTFSLVALDGSHLAVMLKQGTAQYESQAFLSTQDSGKSWSFVKIPNVTLYSFLRVDGQYWAIGTEVIHKDQPGGGYGVPVALYSSDGQKWNHSAGDLSSCKLEMCTVCNTQGCFSSNGVISRVFLEKTTYSAFPSNKELTPKWGSTDSTICFVGSHLQCAALQALPHAPGSAGSPVPTVVGLGSLGAPVSQGPRCIVCGLDRIFTDQKAQGAYTIKLALKIAKNGTVTSTDVQGAPTPEVKSRIEQQTLQWIFEPYLKDGMPVNVTLNTAAKVNVIKPR
ncbi:MAG: YCF48-related protein [Candidatus Acidiferrum sp.]